MKRILVFTCITMLIVLAGAGTSVAQESYKTAPGSNSGPNWFSVQASDLKLWVSDGGIYGGWYQDEDKGLLFHISTPRNPDHYGENGYALHSNPTNDGGHYGEDWNRWAAMPDGVPILAGSTASIAFFAHWDLEENCDGVKLEIASSDDNYTLWTCLQPSGSEPCAFGQCEGTGYCYDGVVGGYGQWETQYTCAIPSNFLGKTVKFRFRIITDHSNVYTGFLVDHFQIIVNGNAVATYDFDDSGPSMWVTDMYWGHTVQSLWTESVLFQGEVIAGISTGYVVDYFDFDWQAFGADYGPPLHLRQTNRWTAPSDQPQFDLDTYYYAPAGSGGGRYIIADCYLKRVSDDTKPFNALYMALHMEPRVNSPFFDVATYDSLRKMIWLNYNNNNLYTCMGIMYLAPNNGNPHAARITNSSQSYWGDDANLYNLMSSTQFDNGPIGPQKSYALISAGPYNSVSLLQCYTQRFTFAFVAADNSSELYTNAQNCRDWYNANLADNPQSPVKVAPTSLGNIKALYQQ